MTIIQMSFLEILTVIITVSVYLFESRCEAFRRLPYMVRQIIIGCIFGALAVFGTEFGIPYEGAVINIRDAAPVCAGMIFGGPAGLIAGLIGGIERWFAVYWGVGVYTRVACTVGTIFAGAFAAFARKFLLEDRRGLALYTVGVAFVTEVFHMLMVFLTNMDDYVYALVVIRHCAPIMIISVTITAGLASAIVNLCSRKRHGDSEKIDGIANKIGMSLFITVAITSIIMVGFVVVYQQRIANQQARTTIETTLDDVAADIEYAEANSDDPEKVIITATKYRRIGYEGIVLVITNDYEPVADSANNAEKGVYNLDAAYIRNHSELIDYMEDGQLYEWITESGMDFIDMIKRTDNYMILGFYPKDEAYIIKWSSVYLSAFALVIILASVFIQIYFLLRSTVLVNIKEINTKLTKITDGDIDAVVEAGGSDEFVSLSNDINSTVSTLKHYINEAETKMDKELELANNIQYSALNREYPESDRFDLYANMSAAREVGGDFYDFCRIGKNSIAFLVADTSGKGIPAAMFMMRSKELIRRLMTSGADVATVLTKANEDLCRNNSTGMSLTVWLGIIDLSTNKVMFSNAGHYRPVVIRNGKEADFVQCSNGAALASREDTEYAVEEIQLERGDSLFLYTSGVIKAMNECREIFGEKRLLAELSETRNMDPVYVCRFIRNSISDFAGETIQVDDITMLAIRIKNENDIDREKIVVPNMESVEEVEEYFQRREEQLDIPMALGMKINIIIDELYSNIVRYSGASMAKISMKRNDDIVTMEFKDNGISYNPLEKDDPDITLSAEERDIGGLGIFMVKNMTESMEYDRLNGKNILTIRIRLDEENNRKKTTL